MGEKASPVDHASEPPRSGPSPKYLSESRNATVQKYSVTSKSPAFTILLKYKYKSIKIYLKYRK